MNKRYRFLTTKEISKKIKDKTDSIIIGQTYFLSDFYDSGAFVVVRNKSKKINSAGWPSTVTVEILSLHNYKGTYHFIGKTTIVNASNLYTEPRLASAAFKFSDK
jgi:hypothetical protein